MCAHKNLICSELKAGIQYYHGIPMKQYLYHFEFSIYIAKVVGLSNISINRQYRLIKYPQYNYCMHLAFAILSSRQYLSHLAIIIAIIV